MKDAATPSPTPTRPPPLALSGRQAARLLRTDRGTLALLVKRGIVRSVPWGNTCRIPLREVERLAVTGWTLTPAGQPRRARARKVNVASDPAAALARLRVEDI